MASKWEPVENGTYYGTDAQQWDYQVEGKVIRAKFQNYLTSMFRIPFDWRICRPVPDAGAMPSEIAETIQDALVSRKLFLSEHLELHEPDKFRELSARYDEALAWLAQQPTAAANAEQA